MSHVIAVTTFVVACLASAVATGALRAHLLRMGMIDRPGARSLHSQPTPRGAGLAIAAVALAAQCILVLGGWLPRDVGIALCVTGLGFALLGWADDRRSRPVSFRIVIQIILASGFAAVAHRTLPAAWYAQFGAPMLLGATVMAVVWFVNLFNFMDGSDGFSGTQAVLAALGGAGVFSLAGDPGAALALLAVAGSSAGFLVWNWPPARVFMGDSGSYFLGFQFGAMLLIGTAQADGIAAILILTAPFVVDATLTLLRRAIRGERWWQAHRSHAYQRMILNGWSPSSMVAALALLNLVVGWPLAFYSLNSGNTFTSVIVSYALTGIMWLAVMRRYRVATDEKQR